MLELNELARARLQRMLVRLSAPPAVDPPPAVQIIEEALAWLEDNVFRVDPEAQSRANAPGTPTESPLVEVTVVLRWLHHRQLTPSAAQRVERCLDRVAEIFQRPSVRDRLFRQTPALQYYVWLAVLLRDCGRLTDPREWATVQRLIDSDYANLHNPTHSAHALMERRYIFDLGGFRHSLPEFDELYPRNVLGAPIDPLFITDFEAYAVTHIVLYLSDMGLRRVTGVTAQQRREMTVAVESLLELYLSAGHLDLTAELLVCRHALELPATGLASYAYRCLLGARLSNGAWPGPFFNPRIAERLSDDRDAYLFRTCYHTTLVALMAVCVEEGM